MSKPRPSGLYWDVHDYLAATAGDAARQQWTQAWGDVVEAMVEDEMAPHAPPVLDGGRSIWTEDNLAAAYGASSKRADMVIDAGLAFVSLDVVSSQLTTATRIDGDAESFKKDLQKLVFKKAHQLDETAKNLIGDESLLTGLVPDPRRPVYPVVVVGSSFARHPVVARYIEEYITNNDLLAHALIKPLSVIDITEVEMLEGLVARGHGISELLDGWHRSGIESMSLRNYLLERFPWEPGLFRSPRMQDHVTKAFDGIISRLDLAPVAA
jgi:hypothetical protein